MADENVFREVDEELRRERMRNFWRRFAPWIIGAAVAVVLAVALNEGWAWLQQSGSAKASDQFYAALDKAGTGDVAGAQEALNQTIADGGAGYQTLARFKQAALLGSDGKPDEAVAAYDALASAQSDSHLRDLALLLAGGILVDHGSLADVQARVGGLAVDGNALRNAARELVGLAQYKAGALADAKATFKQITDDPLASRDLVSRVGIYQQQLDAQADVVLPAPPADPIPTAGAVGELPSVPSLPADVPALPDVGTTAPAAIAPLGEMVPGAPELGATPVLPDQPGTAAPVDVTPVPAAAEPTVDLAPGVTPDAAIPAAEPAPVTTPEAAAPAGEPPLAAPAAPVAPGVLTPATPIAPAAPAAN